MVWYNPMPAAEENQSASPIATGAAETTVPGGTEDAIPSNTSNSGNPVAKSGGFKLLRRPTPMPTTRATAAAMAAVDDDDDVDPATTSINTTDDTTVGDPTPLTRSISMKATRSFQDYFSSLTARNICGPDVWNADNDNSNDNNTGDEPEARDQTDSNNNNNNDKNEENDGSDESYVHPFERRGWDSPWASAGDHSVKTAKKDNKSSSPYYSFPVDDNNANAHSTTSSEDRDPAPASNAQHQHHHQHLDLAGTMSSGGDGDSVDTYTALGSPSLDTDADMLDADYMDESMCSYASWCGGGNDIGSADVIGPITAGRVARDVKALLLHPLGSCDKIGRRRRRGDDLDLGGRYGGSFAEDTTTSWVSAESQTINTYEEDDYYSLASELSADVVSGGGRSVGSKNNALFANFGTVRQKDRAPPMPTCHEEDGEGQEVTVTQHKRQLSTENVPVASLPYMHAPRPSSPASSQYQVGPSPTHVTSFDNVIDLRTPKPIKRSKSFSKTEALKRRKEVEAKIRAEHRVAKAQREREKAIEKAKLEALRYRQEEERRIAEVAEAEARRIEKEEARARKILEIEQRKHEAHLAAARKEQQREEERARKMEEKRLEAEAKAREAEERRNAQLAEAEQKRLDRETAKEQAKEQKLAAIAQKKAVAEEKKKAKDEKKAAKRAKKNKKKGTVDDGTPDEIQNMGDGPNAYAEDAESPATDSSIATPNADNVTRSDQIDGEKSADTAKVEGNNTPGTTDEASGGIFDSVVPALGAASAAGALMFSDFVDSITNPVGTRSINKEKKTEESDEQPTVANHPPSSDSIAEFMSGFGFGDAVKDEVSDEPLQQSSPLSPELPEETNATSTMKAVNPSMPETSKVIESDQLFDGQGTREATSNKTDTLKKASVAALVAGAFARTRSISRSRDRERKLENNEEERKKDLSKSDKSKATVEIPTNRGRSHSRAHRRRSSSRGPSNRTASNAIVRPSTKEEPPPSVVRNRAIVYQSFSNDPVNSLKMYKFISSIALPQASDDVFIKVQASTISFSDCLIRQGMWWGRGSISLPATPGVDVVGRVCNISAMTSRKFNIRSGDYVAALIRCGGNARYVKASGSSLVKVPTKVAPAAAACMVETYLSAFQSLHVGEPSSSRYSFSCYAGQNILVIGGISMVGQAMIELARLGGAARVYATARQKHHSFLRTLGAIPLPIGIDEWMPTFSEQMDVVVDAYCINHYNATSKSLKQGGKLVCIRSRPLMEEQDLVWHVDASTDRTARFYGKMICTYDIFESWEGNLRLCKNDLGYLFDMLSKGKVKPPTADCISLDKVAETQKLFEGKRVQGFFVCKPWLK